MSPTRNTRARQPSMRAMEAADAQASASAATAPTRRSSRGKQSSPPPPPVTVKKQKKAPAKRKPAGRTTRSGASSALQESTVEEDEEEEGEKSQDDEEMQSTVETDSGEQQAGQDLTLYCICLGYDNGDQPMMECQHCSNWFHFGCIGMDEENASKIETYSCEICTEMGSAPTQCESFFRFSLVLFEASIIGTSTRPGAPTPRHRKSQICPPFHRFWKLFICLRLLVVGVKSAKQRIYLHTHLRWDPYDESL
ncbi:hypothetical protein T439DRAFT_323475 [Meredithblackwellia eburnea MCA 4105]